MSLLLPLLIAKGAETAVNALNKPKKIKTDTSAIERNIAQMTSQNAKSDIYNQNVKAIAQNVNPQMRVAQSELQNNINKSGLANTPYATSQENALQQQGLAITGNLAENAIGQEIQQQQQNKSAIQQAREHLQMIKEQDRIANQQQKQQWLGSVIQSGLGTVASFAQGMAQNQQNKAMSDALTQQYTQAGLDPNEVNATVSGFQDYPELANRVLSTKLDRQNASNKINASYQALQTVLTPEQQTAYKSFTTPEQQASYLDTVMSTPQSRALMNVQQQQAYDNAVRPEIEKSLINTSKFAPEEIQGKPITYLNALQNLENNAIIGSQSLDDKSKQAFVNFSATMPAFKAYAKVQNQNERDAFATLSNSYTQVPDKIKKNIMSSIVSGDMSYQQAKQALDEYAQNMPKPTKESSSETKATIRSKSEFTIPVSNAKAKFMNKKIFDDAFFKYNDKSGQLKSSMMSVFNQPTSENLTNALNIIDEKISGFESSIGSVPKFDGNYTPENQAKVTKLRFYLSNLKNLRKEIDNAQSKYSNMLASDTSEF